MHLLVLNVYNFYYPYNTIISFVILTKRGKTDTHPEESSEEVFCVLLNKTETFLNTDTENITFCSSWKNK